MSVGRKPEPPQLPILGSASDRPVGPSGRFRGAVQRSSYKHLGRACGLLGNTHYNGDTRRSVGRRRALAGLKLLPLPEVRPVPAWPPQPRPTGAWSARTRRSSARGFQCCSRRASRVCSGDEAFPSKLKPPKPLFAVRSGGPCRARSPATTHSRGSSSSASGGRASVRMVDILDKERPWRLIATPESGVPPSRPHGSKQPKTGPGCTS